MSRLLLWIASMALYPIASVLLVMACLFGVATMWLVRAADTLWDRSQP